jgi:hypothetical protein
LSEFLWTTILNLDEAASVGTSTASAQSPSEPSAPAPAADGDLDDFSEDELEAMLASRLGGKR